MGCGESRLDRNLARFFNRPEIMSRHALIVLVATLLVAAAGCVKPSETFDEFADRVIDASSGGVEGCNGGELPDFNGQFFLGLSAAIAPNAPLLFVVDSTVTGQAVDLTFQPLCAREGDGAQNCGDDYLTPIGSPLVVEDVAIDQNCTFQAELIDATVPGKANPISGSDIRGDIVVIGTVRSTDLYCGDIGGQLKEPLQIPLDGSTFAAQRIEPGTVGDALPEPLAECPAEDEPDAGMPDAGTPDAGADAGDDAGA